MGAWRTATMGALAITLAAGVSHARDAFPRGVIAKLRTAHGRLTVSPESKALAERICTIARRPLRKTTFRKALKRAIENRGAPYVESVGAMLVGRVDGAVRLGKISETAAAGWLAIIGQELGPRLLQGSALRRALTVSAGTRLYRGMWGRFDDGMIAELLSKPTSVLAAGSTRAGGQVTAARAEVRTVLNALQSGDSTPLQRILDTHTDGKTARRSPLVSTSRDARIAAHFANLGGRDALLVTLSAPPNAIDINEAKRQLGLRSGTNEAEVGVPGAITTGEVDKVLRLQRAPGGMRVVEIWQRDGNGGVQRRSPHQELIIRPRMQLANGEAPVGIDTPSQGGQ